MRARARAQLRSIVAACRAGPVHGNHAKHTYALQRAAVLADGNEERKGVCCKARSRHFEGLRTDFPQAELGAHLPHRSHMAGVPAPVQLVDVHVTYAHSARVWCQDAGEELREGGLAGAAAAHDCRAENFRLTPLHAACLPDARPGYVREMSSMRMPCCQIDAGASLQPGCVACLSSCMMLQCTGCCETLATHVRRERWRQRSTSQR
jgi:hypothetical protein